MRVSGQCCGALKPENEFPHLAACGALGGFLRMIELTKTYLRLSEKDVAGFCQMEMTALAMKEFDPQLAFELVNVLSQCRLGDVQPLRCSSDMQGPGYFDEVPKMTILQHRLLT
jgi:hypothetical protein